MFFILVQNLKQINKLRKTAGEEDMELLSVGGWLVHFTDEMCNMIPVHDI
jgi:hypothetical protein